MNNKEEKSVMLWEDKEIKFDVPHLHERLRAGEKILDNIYAIEDTKGNPGEKGRLLATSLRLIWHSQKHKSFNLSIGYARIINTNTRFVETKIGGSNTQALYVLVDGIKTRFEFLFTDVSGEVNRKKFQVFQGVFEICKNYQRTSLYREIKLRGAIVQSGQLIVLPDEQIYSSVNGVWNLSSDTGNLGSFIITNIRLVWFADANELFNITLPYLQIESIRIRESKYGPALVIQTLETGGNFTLGFRIDPVERLNEIQKELIALHTIYIENPNLGVAYNSYNVQLEQRLAERAEDEAFKAEDFEEIDELQEREIDSKLNRYLAESCSFGGTSKQNEEFRGIFYCKELGFAMERLRDGYTLKDLWDVIPQGMFDIDDDNDDD